MNRQIVRPQDAASLILVRDGPGEPEVLMGRRQSRMTFMPDVYVFPGGKLDAGDGSVRAASPLDAGIIRHLAVAGSARRAQALAIAAVRETFEETGLLLGQPGDAGGLDTPAWAAFKQAGLAPALDKLCYVTRAITPTFSPIRFHARFFLADTAHVRGVLGGSGELLDLRWVPLSEANRLPIADVTVFVLGEVQRLLTAPPENHARKALFTHRRNGLYVRYS